MERCGKMDAARRASARIPLIRTAYLLLLLACCAPSAFATDPPPGCTPERVKDAFARQHWQEVVELAPCVPPPSADVQFYYGTALAKLEKWDAAALAFRTGQQLSPDLPADLQLALQAAERT